MPRKRSGRRRGADRVETTSAALAAVTAQLLTELGQERVVTDLRRRRTYECDGLAAYRVVPGLVVLARDAADVVATVRACAAWGTPFVARGSGTGLSGGALPHSEGVLVVMSRMREIREIDVAAQRAVVDPGVINLGLTAVTSPDGYYFAPDPSSQSVCSIGGNVAENSGGAHCLKYGFTTNHVTGLDLVSPDGERITIGGKAPDPPGYDLLGALVGSEGTLGVVTSVTVRLTRLPQEVRTLLAAFGSIADAGAATSAIIAAGVIPAAVEMMDALAIEAAEAAVRCDYPAGADAVLIIELDGHAADVAEEFDEVVRLCEADGAFEVRVAADDVERDLIWKGRKSAFAAVGRISPDYIVQDGVIPRTCLPQVLAGIAELGHDAGVRVANVFHAGDGNLHPLVLFDGAEDGALERAQAVATGILDLCLAHGGSITGEHGVGADKAGHMPRMFTPDDLAVMQAVRCAFDPESLSNPGKIFPTPRLCGERPGRRSGAHPLSEAGVAEVF